MAALRVGLIEVDRDLDRLISSGLAFVVEEGESLQRLQETRPAVVAVLVLPVLEK